MSDYFDYPQDARDTRQPTSPHLRPFYDCDDCGHPSSAHSHEKGIGCLNSAEYCPCLRPGTSQADQ